MPKTSPKALFYLENKRVTDNQPLVLEVPHGHFTWSSVADEAYGGWNPWLMHSKSQVLLLPERDGTYPDYCIG